MLLSAALFFASAFARDARAVDIRVDGDYRLRLAFNTDLMLDDANYRLNQTAWAEHRLRLNPKIVDEGVVEIQASFDILSGLIGGELAPGFQGLGWDGRAVRDGLHGAGFDFRHFFAEVRFPVGLLQVGQMPSQWGLGMVANGGDDGIQPDFGDVRFGDIVERVLFATRPLAFLGPHSELAQHLSTALAGDLVYRDRTASLLINDGGGLQVGDLAFQAVGVLRYSLSDKSVAGFYLARRVESFAHDQGNLHIWIFDLHARTLFESKLFGGSTLALETELAQINGGTSHSVNLNSLVSTRVNQQGAVLRATLSVSQLETELEGGYASGDSNPFDSDNAAFVFNRDYKVGLVLFDEVLLFQSQNSARRLADPRLSGRPPNGVDLIPTEGAVTDALYLKPTMRYRPALFAGRVRLVGSVLWAHAPQPYTDAYNSLLASSPRNTFNAPAGQNYGVELDGAISYRQKIGTEVGLEFGVQSGVLFPGNAFNRPDGTRMDKAYATKFRAGVTF